ncbi:endophilin-A isoform X2 [Neocloeon triangulifer]|uniref:endophilin-A isoform X2 n=1 Tax=Neocloeon triangulifer TaxID=2078957 RepID=UPI00286FA119|nr:endophilin-A isoform X2 [Neocloeon triangulifer]
MAFAGLKKQINKANQYMTEKMGGAEGTKLDNDFMEMERKTDVTNELVEELQMKTREYLQPNPNARAKMAAVKGISKLSGQAKANTYPQPEGVLGDCMVTYGKKLGEDCHFGAALVEFGEALKQMADVKYSLDDNIKQNFLEPLHALQMKDLKEVMHHRKKLQGRRLDFDCKRRKQSKGVRRGPNLGPGPYGSSTSSPYGSPARSPVPPGFGSQIPDDDIKHAEEKFAESLHLAQLGMFNLLENDVEQISQLATFAEGMLEYHQQCTEILKVLNETMQEKREEAAERPKAEFVPKTLADLSIEPIMDGLNVMPGRSPFHSPASTPVHQPNSLLFANNSDNAHSKGTTPSQDEGYQGSSQHTSPVLNKPNQLELGASEQQARSNAASPLPSPMRSPARTPMNQTPCCKALYDFDAQNPGELEFKEGDNITLVNRVDENWYEGSVNGKTGYFPQNYVQVVVPLP